MPAEGGRRNTPIFLAEEGAVSLPTLYFKPALAFMQPISPTLYLLDWGRKSTRIFPQSTLVPSIPQAVKAMNHPPFICFEDLPWQPLS